MTDAPCPLPRSVAAAVLLSCCAGAAAQQVDDRYWLSVAGYRPSIESTARSDPIAAGRPGTEVSFEDELGLTDRKTLPWFQAGLRAGERLRFELEYFSLRRSGSRSASREIAWGDTVFPATATLSSTFDSDILRLSGGYSFVRNDRSEAGAVLGLHMTRFRLELSTQVSLGAATGAGQAEAEEALVPLPTVGLFASHALSRSWVVAGRVDYFALDTGDYDGGLVNATASITWRASDRIGVSAGYRYVDYSLDVDRTSWRGGVDYRFSGPFLALQLGL